MRVIYHDVEAKLPLGNAKPAGSLSELLEQADVVTLHVLGGKSTSNLMNAKILAHMKRGAILINA
jgi:D-3-phosphoglycerate dehydrogenase / 2-oxoglutarate reductase